MNLATQNKLLWNLEYLYKRFEVANVSFAFYILLSMHKKGDFDKKRLSQNKNNWDAMGKKGYYWEMGNHNHYQIMKKFWLKSFEWNTKLDCNSSPLTRNYMISHHHQTILATGQPLYVYTNVDCWIVSWD